MFPLENSRFGRGISTVVKPMKSSNEKNHSVHSLLSQRVKPRSRGTKKQISYMKILASPLDSKEIKPVNPKGNPPWMFIEGVMLKLKPQYFGHLMSRADSLGKNPGAGKDWRQKANRVVENEVVRWNHQLSGHESEHTPGSSVGQGSTVCSSSWVAKSQTRLSDQTVTVPLIRAFIYYYLQPASTMEPTYIRPVLLLRTQPSATPLGLGHYGPSQNDLSYLSTW